MNRNFAVERFAKVLEESFQKYGAEILEKIELEESKEKIKESGL